jgi:hypothetical protein
MRILAPSFLHHQSLSGWTTYELLEKNHFVIFDARFDVFSAKSYYAHTQHAPNDFKRMLSLGFAKTSAANISCLGPFNIGIRFKKADY